MDNARHIRLNKLKSRFPDVITAYEFCKNNPDKFISRIHGPVALVVNVKDVRYASMVEQILGGAGSSHLRVSGYFKKKKIFSLYLIQFFYSTLFAKTLKIIEPLLVSLSMKRD